MRFGVAPRHKKRKWHGGSISWSALREGAREPPRGEEVMEIRGSTPCKDQAMVSGLLQVLSLRAPTLKFLVELQ